MSDTVVDRLARAQDCPRIQSALAAHPAVRAAAVSERWEETMAWVREEMGRDRQVDWQWIAPDRPAALKADVPIEPPVPQQAVA